MKASNLNCAVNNGDRFCIPSMGKEGLHESVSPSSLQLEPSSLVIWSGVSGEWSDNRQTLRIYTGELSPPLL
jgi:hypothetical protein